MYLMLLTLTASCKPFLDLSFLLIFMNECRQGLSKIGNGQTEPSLILGAS